jgi:molybdopterin-guanine dinucleotide biosynthesis protein A
MAVGSAAALRGFEAELNPASMISASQILGVILAGGAGRRMFETGGDKALINLGGAPILAHVITAVAPQVGALILNANGDPERFQRFGLTVVSDLDDTRLGPLAGFAAAFAYAAKQAPPPRAALTVTADAPFLPSDLAQRLSASGGPAIATSGGKRHPTIGFWPLDIRPSPADALADGCRSANAFAERHHAIEVEFPSKAISGVDVDPFFNANTPDDIEAARRILAGQP